MNIVVTGASGYLGRRLVPLLRTGGHRVTGLSRTGSTDLVACDLAREDAVQRIFEKVKPDLVVHAAAYIPRKGDPDVEDRSRNGNVDTVRAVADAAVACGTQGLVNLSSIAVYGECPLYAEQDVTEDAPPAPDSPYGRDKLRAEEVVADLPFPTVSLRLAGLHGSGRRGGVIHNFLRAAMSGEPIAIPAPQTEIAPLWVDDAARAIGLASAALIHGELPPVLNLSGNDAMTLNALAEAAMQAAGRTVPVIPGDGMPVRRIMSNVRAREVLNFTATPIADWLLGEVRLLNEVTE